MAVRPAGRLEWEWQDGDGVSAAVGWQCVCERRGRWMMSANELMAMVMPPSARRDPFCEQVVSLSYY